VSSTNLTSSPGYAAWVPVFAAWKALTAL
jgi:hypothetical protein